MNNRTSENRSIDSNTPDIRNFLNHMMSRSAVIEIRALNVAGRGRPMPVAGYFDNLDQAVAAVNQLLHRRATGIYVTLNEVKSDLLARAANRLADYPQSTTSDADVVRRKLLLIDIDANRPSGVSSTQEELDESWRVAASVVGYTQNCAWPDPVIAMSGNGYHLLYSVDLPNDTASTELIKELLKLFDRYFSTSVAVGAPVAAKIDTSVSNAARITKVIGTPARKGDSTVDRPHRVSQVLSMPVHNSNVTKEMIQAVIAACSAAENEEGTEHEADWKTLDFSEYDYSGPAKKLNVSLWLQEKGVAFNKKAAKSNGRDIYELDVCPFNENHNRREAVIMQDSRGKLAFKCQHDSCSDKGWQDAKTKYGAPSDRHFDSLKSDSGFSKPGTIGQLKDIDAATLFAEAHQHSLKYCHALRTWFEWDGKRWRPDETGSPMRAAKEFVSYLFDKGVRLQDTNLCKFASQNSKRERLRAMLELAQSDLSIQIEHLDRQPMLLTCPNGTLDLRTGQLRAHCRDDLLTKCCPTHYQPSAVATRFQQFLNEVFAGDQELIGFMQRLVGYSLTGGIEAHVLPVCYGDGSNGKSTLLNTVLSVLGSEFSMQAEPDLLVAGKRKGHSTDRMDLFGMRVVVASETGFGEVLNLALVKLLTGGEKIRGRRMRQDNWEFDPTHTIFLCTNHLPIIPISDPAIWRRILLIPFKVQFEGPMKDPDLPRKLQAESEGILAWAVQGCLAYQQYGLCPPESVRAATAEYESEEDSIGKFVEEMCIVEPGQSVRFSKLYGFYEGWTEINGAYQSTRKFFGDWMRRKNFQKRMSNGPVYIGIGLKGPILSDPTDFS